MTSIGGYYANPHVTQFDGAPLAGEACVPASAANGIDASTGGKVHMTSGEVHLLVPKAAETDPHTPGWSLTDLDRAMTRAGIPFDNRTGQGWAAVVAAWDAGLYVVLQGDSDQFGDATCSGAYDGDHCVGCHCATRLVDGLRQRWINDPICPSGRWEFEYVLHRYAAKFSESIRFGVFPTPVPRAVVPPSPVTLRYGGHRLVPARHKRISVPAGRRANVRAKPTTRSAVVTTLANGRTFTAHQRTSAGQTLAGSSVWFGDRTGTRWLHVTAF